MDAQDDLVATLRAHEAELRAAGIGAISLFGSVARREERPNSDIDLAVRLDPGRHVGLFGLVALETRLTALLGRPVQLLPEPVSSPRLRANLDRDRRHVF
jgi:predicted nucleotidyltransferase